MNGADARRRLLATIPITQRRLHLAGVSTAVLEGGNGAPVVLLHGPGESAVKWSSVVPRLVATHHVVAPDLPGHGESEVAGVPLDGDRTICWLDELIERTCMSPPALVGHGLSLAARYAVDHSDRLSCLVLVDILGLEPFEPAPEFAAALDAFAAQPTDETYDDLWRHCAFDLDGLRGRMGEDWRLLRTYHLDRARDESAQAELGALMSEEMAPVSAAKLARITAPTTLIWGRHDRATPLRIAEAASARHGWPVRVIERAADDPALEQPEAFHAALLAATDAGSRPEARR
jgi:pimeloyl-ACP methyl ester carboxylesterase